MDAIGNIIGDYKKFLDNVYINLEGVGIDIDDSSIDHIAYRSTTNENYEALKKRLLVFGEVISEIIIRDRPVAIFRLDEPLNYNGMKISYFEILAPAQNDTFKEGLEHAEFVVNVPLPEFIKKYPSIDFILREKEINSELILKFPNSANAKFHELPIDEVIGLQETLFKV
jgi:uncharacterized protein